MGFIVDRRPGEPADPAGRTVREPQVRGQLEVHNGRLCVVPTGARYEDIQARVRFAGERVVLRLKLKGGSGAKVTSIDLLWQVDY